MQLFLILFIVNGHASFAVAGPKVWVLIEEKVIWILDTTDISEQPGQAETTLIEGFLAHGFDVVDSAMVRKNIIQAKGLRDLEGDQQAVAAIGLEHGAQYSVVGNAIAKLGTVGISGSNMKTVHATVTARIIRNADARIIASFSASATVPHLDEIQGGTLAIQKAARRLADKLNAKFQEINAQELQSGRTVTLRLSHLSSYSRLESILSVLEKNIPAVESAHLDTFTTGTAVITILYLGDVRNLAGSLTHEDFSGFRLEPTHMTPDSMDLSVVSLQKNIHPPAAQ